MPRQTQPNGTGFTEQKTARVEEMKLCIGSESDLLRALQSGTDPGDVVPVVLDVLECDPLASAGYFRGDLLRALIDLPANFWRRDRVSFARYQAAVRAGAIARRGLPSAERMAFWTNAEG
ncbi:MAG: contact-dependent growth inhibition system immunity protein [Gemmatimonadaceae bacterium]